MKVYLNRKPVEGPWGGGNRTIKTLIKQLTLSGHEYTFNLSDNFDVIYCHDPRPDNRGIRYEHLLHIKQNKKVPIFQRVGDVFYHRGIENTEYLKETIKYSDKVSFITDWAANFLSADLENKRYLVHELRPPEVFFKDSNFKKTSDKIRIFTHHWSNNSLKGLDFYNKLGSLLLKEKYDLVDFFYLGRAHKDLNQDTVKILSPVDTHGVIRELDSSDIYVTASEYETGGNHVVEAMARGLPVVYHKNGGGINSLCKNKNMEFESIEDFESILDCLLSEIDFKNKKSSYLSNSLEDVCNSYIDEMEKLII